MTKQENNNTEQNIAITILCATLWLIFACYLASVPVEASQHKLTDIEEFALCNEVTDIE